MGLLGRLFGGIQQYQGSNCYSNGMQRYQGGNCYSNGMQRYKSGSCFGGMQQCQGGDCFGGMQQANFGKDNMCNNGDCGNSFAPQGLFGGGGLFGGIMSFFQQIFGGLFGGFMGFGGNDYGLGGNDCDFDEENLETNTNNSEMNIRNMFETNSKGDKVDSIDGSKKITDKSNPANKKYAKQFLNAINKLRASKGLSPLRLSEELCKGSQIWANKMANGLGMVHSNLKIIGQTGGYDGFVNGENIATTMRRGAEGVKEAFNMWKNSGGHYANMMNPNARDLGIAFCGNKWIMTTGRV